MAISEENPDEPHPMEQAIQAAKAAEFSLTRDEWLSSFLRLADAAEEKKDFTGSRACLREIGLAMGNWYEAQPDQSDNKLEIVIRKL